VPTATGSTHLVIHGNMIGGEEAGVNWDLLQFRGVPTASPVRQRSGSATEEHLPCRARVQSGLALSSANVMALSVRHRDADCALDRRAAAGDAELTNSQGIKLGLEFFPQ
jgi:hypothetical protein